METTTNTQSTTANSTPSFKGAYLAVYGNHTLGSARSEKTAWKILSAKTTDERNFLIGLGYNVIKNPAKA